MYWLGSVETESCRTAPIIFAMPVRPSVSAYNFSRTVALNLILEGIFQSLHSSFVKTKDGYGNFTRRSIDVSAP